MVTDSPVIPFYLMEHAKEFGSGRPPKDPYEEAAGLKKAIEATKIRIADYKNTGADVSDLETHLKNLEQRLETAKRK